MTGPGLSRARTERQAKLLLDPEHYGLLSLVMRGDVSAAEVARTLDWPLQTAHYKLGRLVEAEIAVVTGEEKRAGRAVKRYSSARPEWFVPYELTSAATLADLVAAQLEPRMRRVYDRMAEELTQFSPHQGVTLRMVGDVLTVRLAPPGTNEVGGSSTSAALSGLRLSPERAREFHDKLEALAQEFVGAPDQDGEDHILGLFFIRGKLA